jgi:hypothetical protein
LFLTWNLELHYGTTAAISDSDGQTTFYGGSTGSEQASLTAAPSGSDEENMQTAVLMTIDTLLQQLMRRDKKKESTHDPE